MGNDAVIQGMKFAIAAIGGVILHMLGGGDAILQLFGALIAFDFVLGSLKAMKTSTFQSRIMRWGAVNKALEVIVIMIFQLFDNTMGIDIFRNGTIVWFCICEAASVLENLVILGVPCPDGLQKTLTQLKVGISISFVDILDKLIEEKLSLKKDKKGENDHDN